MNSKKRDDDWGIAEYVEPEVKEILVKGGGSSASNGSRSSPTSSDVGSSSTTSVSVSVWSVVGRPHGHYASLITPDLIDPKLRNDLITAGSSSEAVEMPSAADKKLPTTSNERVTDVPATMRNKKPLSPSSSVNTSKDDGYDSRPGSAGKSQEFDYITSFKTIINAGFSI